VTELTELTRQALRAACFVEGTRNVAGCVRQQTPGPVKSKAPTWPVPCITLVCSHQVIHAFMPAGQENRNSRRRTVIAGGVCASGCQHEQLGPPSTAVVRVCYPGPGAVSLGVSAPLRLETYLFHHT
jgi:hypothetical protein